LIKVGAAASLVRLARGPLEMLLAPGVGGCIARFDHFYQGARTPILRGADGVPGSVLDAGSFPLLPYCNRIRDGRFTFRGRDVAVAPNMAGDPSPLHGQGWLAAWDVAKAGDAGAELVFRHEATEWPWTYQARQLFRLDESGVSIRLSCRNLSPDPMPCGLGQHPYFHCAAETRLDTEVATAWTIDDKVLPLDHVATIGRYDLRERLVCGQGLDNGFGGWGGTARISTPGAPFEIAMSSPNASFFQLYSPVEGGLFVAEPVTHANAALNAPEADWPMLGLRVLAPGEEMALDMRIAVTG